MATLADRVIERSLQAADEDLPEDDIGELNIAEYIVFLLALDTYTRYVEERAGDDAEDDLIKRGVALIRLADRKHLAAIQSFLGENLPSAIHQKMLSKAFRFVPNSSGLSRRSLQLRTLLSRGGPTTMRAVFKTNKALQEVKAAMAAALVDDADAALDKFAVIPLTNARLRDWIDTAAETAGSGTFQNAVAAGSREAADDLDPIFAARAQQNAAPAASEESATASAVQSDLLLEVQQRAQDSAERALAVSGEPNEPPTRAEVIGIATAAATAAATDPNRSVNVPAPLKSLDEEQIAAALTDGRVLVAAGAGAGKSTTLVSRIEFLVKERKANPSRILACSFNKKAADELKVKIAKKLGYESASGTGVQIGTMHSLFYKFIVGDRQVQGFGTREEQDMLRPPRLIAPPKKGVKSVSPTSLSTAIRSIWTGCGGEALAKRFGFQQNWMEEPPKAKKANLILNKWRGNDVTLEQAKISVKSEQEAKAYVWYEFYMGIKGDIPGWSPPCISPAYDNFMNRNRQGGERLGDLDDMLKVFLSILRRDERARKTVQGMFDHFLVDECQDLNLVQHQIFDLMTEHVTDGSDGKSLWMIGDDKQAIYQFRGARPELFTSLDGKNGWTTRMIRTNYRCEAEIVEAANRLIAHNDGNIPMEARANPKKGRGKASIIVEMPEDNTTAAIDTIGRVTKDIALENAKAEDYAVLARTNAELNDWETACIINEIPYVRRGGKGFLEAPETKAVLGYIDLATGTDYEKMRDSLVSVLMKPDRGLFLGPEDISRAVGEAIDDVARRERVDVKAVSPTALFQSRNIGILADRLKQPYRLKIINSARGDTRKGEWMYNKRVEELTDNLRDLANSVADVRDFVGKEGSTTKDLLDFVLDIKSTVSGWDSVARRATETTVTLREQISLDRSIFSDEDDDGDDEETEQAEPEIGEGGELGTKKEEKKDEEQQAKGLGAVKFLYELAKPNANDQANNTDPSSAQGYVAKIARYSKLAETLRIDPNKWERDQARVDPSQRKAKPPAISLSTVHSVKGLEWPNVTVLMPRGKFPLEPKKKPGDPPPDPVEEAERIKAERNLAYVALTRAAVNLEISCPGGVSPFVFQADLHMGENVPKGEVFESGEKTATEFDPYVEGLASRLSPEFTPSYDRSKP